MKFRALILELHLPQNICYTHIHKQTNRNTSIKRSQTVSRYCKMCKSMKNQKSKIFTKTTFFFCQEKNAFLECYPFMSLFAILGL